MDPGTALRVVSLGITVCQGLLDYYRSWQTYRDDINSTSTSIEHLLQLLCQIQGLLDSRKEDGLQAALMLRIDKTAQKCKSSLMALEAQFLKLKQFNDAQSIRDKLRNKLRRLDYPFRKGTLEGLEREVAKSRTNLVEILNVLQVQQNVEIEGMVERICHAQVKAEVRAWLAAPDPSINQIINFERRHADTGLWFLSDAAFKKWKTREQSSMWLQGSSGSGKSVLCSAVVNDLQQLSTTSENIVTCYYYFTFTDDIKTKVSGLLKSILLQLSVSSLASHSALDSLYATYRDACPPDADLLNAVQTTLLKFSQAFLVVDALDECGEREKLINILNSIDAWRLPHLHLLVTSRAEPYLVRGLPWNARNIMSVQTAGLDDDIKIYVESILTTDESLQRWEILREEIRNALLGRADGM